MRPATIDLPVPGSPEKSAVVPSALAELALKAPAAEHRRAVAQLLDQLGDGAAGVVGDDQIFPGLADVDPLATVPRSVSNSARTGAGDVGVRCSRLVAAHARARSRAPSATRRDGADADAIERRDLAGGDARAAAARQISSRSSVATICTSRTTRWRRVDQSAADRSPTR